jgi:hypothetical protein
MISVSYAIGSVSVISLHSRERMGKRRAVSLRNALRSSDLTTLANRPNKNQYPAEFSAALRELAFQARKLVRASEGGASVPVSSQL